MHVTLKENQIVRCPPDRGNPPFTGRITKIETHVYQNTMGIRFVWVHVINPHGNTSLWASHRLGGTVTE